ncbi:membrane protein [Caballeronia udeis]|uniref:Membrane protein n=1 Tax=Caballeronia udeis TaxID=1232866 RepID=A0A158GWT5_9BURK|nr:membrane protein [Caballeronia udeis]
MAAAISLKLFPLSRTCSAICMKRATSMYRTYALVRINTAARRRNTAITTDKEHAMARIGAFCIASWLAAAILYFGQHSPAMIVLSGVVVLGGFDVLRP